MTSTGPGMIYKLHRWLGCFRSALKSYWSGEQSQNDLVSDSSFHVKKLERNHDSQLAIIGFDRALHCMRSPFSHSRSPLEDSSTSEGPSGES